MAKKATNAQRKIVSVSNPPNAHTASEAAGGSGLGELQQIQDLLFGSQAREIDGNLHALEQKFNARFEQMCQSYDAQIQELNSVIAAQAKKDTAARLAGYKALAFEIESVRAHSAKTVADLLEQQEQAKQTSSTSLDAAITKIEAQWQQQSSQMTHEVREKHSALDKSKVDKQALSNMLSNMATEFE